MIERKSPFGVLEFDQWGFSIFWLGVHNYEQLRSPDLQVYPGFLDMPLQETDVDEKGA